MCMVSPRRVREKLSTLKMSQGGTWVLPIRRRDCRICSAFPVLELLILQLGDDSTYTSQKVRRGHLSATVNLLVFKLYCNSALGVFTLLQKPLFRKAGI